MDLFKKSAKKIIGVGGINCSCCNPYMTDRKSGKQLVRRYARHVLKQMDEIEFAEYYVMDEDDDSYEDSNSD